MITLLVALVLAIVTLTAISLQKVYSHVPTVELRRRARKGDETAKLLYKAAVYGDSMQALLWIIIGLSSAGFFVIVSRSLPSPLALIAALLLLWVGFAWLPNSSIGWLGKQLGRYLTSPLTWMLSKFYPVLNRISVLGRRYGRISVHTGIYQKEDLLELLEKQKSQPDNHIGHTELKVAAGALTFGDKHVADVMTPRRAIKAVAATDTVGPHLLDELHKTGHSRFPVYQDKKDNFVGMLYARDLIEVTGGGQVRNFMKKQLYFVHEEQVLSNVLHAFLITKHHLFLVVNSFEEIVGIITIEDVLEQIVGQPIVDEFDKYDDIRAVAASKAQAEHEQNKSQDKEAVSPTKS